MPLTREVLNEVAQKAIEPQFREPFDRLMRANSPESLKRAEEIVRNWVRRSSKLPPADKTLCELLLDEKFIGAA